MSYPSKEELKSVLKNVCSSDAICEELATQFGGVEINCNHRVPQMAAAKAQIKTQASDDDCEKASELLCSYVDKIACVNKQK